MRSLFHVLTLLACLSLFATAQAAKPASRRARSPSSTPRLATCTARFSKGSSHRGRQLHRPVGGHQGLDQSRVARQKARRSPLRRHDLPSRHPRIHDPGRRSCRQRHGRSRLQVQERNIVGPEVRPPRSPRLRQLRSRHQRLAVLHHRRLHSAHLNGHYTIFGQCDRGGSRTGEENRPHGHATQPTTALSSRSRSRTSKSRRGAAAAKPAPKPAAKKLRRT